MGYKIYAGSIGHYVDNNNGVRDDQMIWVEHALTEMMEALFHGE